MIKISLASDHAGYFLKEEIKSFLSKAGYSIDDFGAFNDQPIDYVDTGLKAAKYTADGNSDIGILICGTGQGMNIIANKVKGIRACLCMTNDFAKLARQHNNANVLVLPGRFIETKAALEIVDTFLNEPFSEETRHKNRIKKINKYENNEV